MRKRDSITLINKIIIISITIIITTIRTSGL